MKLRFKRKYSGLDTPERICYETVRNEPIDYLGKPCYELKIFGFIPCEFLEPAEDQDLNAIDILIQTYKSSI